ncbi:bactericidal permeability-increasing protein-like [Pelodytes ibericus]
MWLWLLWFGFSLQSGLCNPGVIMRVSQKWIDYVRSEGIEVLHHMLTKEPLPNITGSTHMFGHVSYTISGVLIEEFDITRVLAVPNPPSDVHVLVEDAKAKVYGHWKVKHWLINDSGSFNLLLSGVTVTVQLNTFKDLAGRPSVVVSSCYSAVEHAKVHLSGGASWLYNLFTVFLEKPIKNNVNEKLCPRLREAATVLQRELATFTVTSHLYDLSEIDYSLMSPPHVQKTYIDLYLKGTVHTTGEFHQETFPETCIHVPEGRDSMIYVGLSDHFFNSLAKTYFRSDVLKLTLTHEQYPNAFWLRTGDYGTIIPQIHDYYPVSQAMMMTITATKSPVVTVSPHNITLEMTGLVQGLVVLPYFMTKELFSVNVDATFIADKVYLSNLNLIVSFAAERLKFNDFRSFVGTIKVSELEKSLVQNLQESVLRGINAGLRRGIPMPALANISIQESAITTNQGCLLVSMDMYYIPWKELMGMLPSKQHIPSS